MYAPEIMLKRKMVQRVVAGLTSLFLLLVKVWLSQKDKGHPPQRQTQKQSSESDDESVEVEVDDGFCLSWRLGVEANNVRSWRTVPLQCYKHVEKYMTGGQYEQDMNLIVDQILAYASQITLAGDGMDAWILDVDDTCISNIGYYKEKRFG